MNNGHPDTGNPDIGVLMENALEETRSPRVQEIAPPIAPPGQRLTEEERLRIENAYLRLHNMQLQVQGLDRQKEDLVAEMRQVQADMEKFRASLSTKYGTDISRTNVTADGRIMPPGQPLPT